MICDRCGQPGATEHRGTFNFHVACPSRSTLYNEQMAAVERVLLRHGRDLQRGEADEIVSAVLNATQQEASDALIVSCSECGAELRGGGSWLHESDCSQTRLWQRRPATQQEASDG